MTRILPTQNRGETSCREVRNLARTYVQELGKRLQSNPKLILSIWPEIIGSHMAPMTKALSFDAGKLVVLVHNSTLLSLLCRKEDKARLVAAYQARVPGIVISDILFRLG